MRAYQRYIQNIKAAADKVVQDLKKEINLLNKKITQLGDDKDRLLNKTRIQATQIEEMRIKIMNLEYQNGTLRNKVEELESPLPW